MAFPTYTTADTADGTLSTMLLSQQVEADPAIVTTFDGVTQRGTSFTLLFATTPTAPEQAQCDALVAAHTSLPAMQDSLVRQITNKREYRLANVIFAEYPASSGLMFGVGTADQDNWNKLATLDIRGLVSYPFTVHTADHTGSHNLADSADLTVALGTISLAVLIERNLAEGYLSAVVVAPDEAAAQAAAEPYLSLPS